jgi:hypothetical protein
MASKFSIRDNDIKNCIMSILLIDRSIIYCFMFRSRISHSYGGITIDIAGEQP